MTQLTCPSCDAVLKTAKAVTPGTSVRCPKCKDLFEVPEPARASRSGSISGSRGGRPRGKTAATSSGTNWGFIIGIAGGSMAICTLVIVGLVLLFGRKPAPVNPVAVVPQPAPPVAPLPPAPVAVTPAVATPVASNSAAGQDRIRPEVLATVKRATVMIRIVREKFSASGSGFFTVEKGIVVTNAHVVDMQSPTSVKPEKLEVVVNSGEPDERTYPAEILGFDPVADLAVLKLVNADPSLLPPPLPVVDSITLYETQPVFIFGFPLGERLGLNITVSQSSVSSLRKDSQGRMTQVQVNGGMHHGNSGGPVTDVAGNVVCVSVAGVEGTQLNFAVPGESVKSLIAGRVNKIAIGEPTRRGNDEVLPFTLEVLDPLKQIKTCDVDWWVGEYATTHGPSSSQPAAAPGDTPRQSLAVTLQNGAAQGELVLPKVPSGQAVWLQPRYANQSGQTQWGASSLFEPEPTVEPKDISLAHKIAAGQRKLHLNTTSAMQMRSDGEDHAMIQHIDTRMIENIQTQPQRIFGALVVQKLNVGGSVDSQPPPGIIRLQRLVQDISSMQMDFSVEPNGALGSKRVDVARVQREGQTSLSSFGLRLLESLDLSSIPLPNGPVKPGSTWQARRKLPVDTLEGFEYSQIDISYTYKGTTVRNGKTEAYVTFAGGLLPADQSTVKISGRLRGTARIDAATGEVTRARIKADATMDIEVGRNSKMQFVGLTTVSMDRTPMTP